MNMLISGIKNGYKDLQNHNSPLLDFKVDWLNNVVTFRLIWSLVAMFLLCCFCIIAFPIILLLDLINAGYQLLSLCYKPFLTKLRIKKNKKIFEHWFETTIDNDKRTHYYYFKEYINYSPGSLNNFLRDFFIKNNNYTTYWGINQICDPGRRRSLGDIYLICKYYFPGVTIEQVIKHLIKQLKKGHIGASYCNTIHKYVFHTQNTNWEKSARTEYNNLNFKDILEIYE